MSWWQELFVGYATLLHIFVEWNCRCCLLFEQFGYNLLCIRESLNEHYLALSCLRCVFRECHVTVSLIFSEKSISFWSPTAFDFSVLKTDYSEGSFDFFLVL